MKWYSTKKYIPIPGYYLVRLQNLHTKTVCAHIVAHFNNVDSKYFDGTRREEKYLNVWSVPEWYRDNYEMTPTHFMHIPPMDKHDIQDEPNLFMQLEDVDFTHRTYCCLKAENINTLGKLITFSESDLLKTPNLGKKSLNEIKEVLEKYELSLSQ